MNVKKSDTIEKLRFNFVSCLDCARRSLLRTTCHFGMKQEFCKQKCKYFEKIKED